MNMKLQRKFAWGITGSGDEIKKIFSVMKEASNKFRDVKISVFISKSGEQVLRWYRLLEEIQKVFPSFKVETSPNTPFLAGEIQTGKYDFMIIAPTTSNTTAKLSLGIGDTMITNAVNMASKAYVPVYVLPCEIGEEDTITTLPNGKELRLKIRRIDSQHINSLEKSDEITVLQNPDEILSVIEGFYGEKKDL
jgi:archaeoflavoprotein AfpA